MLAVLVALFDDGERPAESRELFLEGDGLVPGAHRALRLGVRELELRLEVRVDELLGSDCCFLVWCRRNKVCVREKA